MDKREAIRAFIKRNSATLRQDPFPGQVYKRLKHDFFIEQMKSPVPKDSEIAGEIIEGMITNSQINKKEDLDTLLALPFFNEKIQNKQYYYEKLELKSKQRFPLLDIESLKKTENAERIRDALKEQLKEEVIGEKISEIQQWDQKILEKTEEYSSIPSIVDGEDYPLPDDLEGEKTTEQLFVPWWEKLGLKEDPFRDLEGLSRIDPSLHNRVLHKTEIFTKYESMVENSPTELFRNTVVYGQYGAGKTTFFDFMCSFLISKKIYPIYTQLGGGGDFEVRELIFEFRKKITVELKRLHTVFAGDSAPPVGTLDDEEAIADLMKRLSYRGAKGFVIFIDDLHKGDLEIAMRFMSYLQVLSAQFRRATDLNIGFFVAGSIDEWEPKINSSPKFSGSIDRQEHIPVLKPEVALDAINRRLKAFAKNPENPRQIERLFVDRIYKALQHNSQDITFRRVMREMLNEFESGHFDPLSANPIKIPASTLNSIKVLLESNLENKKRLERIISTPILTPQQKSRCLELLVQAYAYNGLRESDIREYDVPFLQRLKHSGLIVKVSEEGSASWKIARDLYEINKRIIREHGLSLEDYLVRLYSAQLPDTQKGRKQPNEEIVQIESLLTFIDRDLSWRLLNEAKGLHLAILESKEKYLNLEENAAVVIDKCTVSLARLTKAYMFYGRAKAPHRTDLQTLFFWKDFWWSPEAILQFVRAASSEMENKQKIPLILALYKETFPQIVSFFESEYKNSKTFYIPLTYLKNDEIKLLHDCRQSWNDDKFNEVADMLVSTVERKLKLFLYNLFTVLYGEYEQRIKLFDRESRLNILNKTQEGIGSSFAVKRNEFQYLARSHFKRFMTGIEGNPEGRHNWRNIFSSVFFNWHERELYDYLVSLAEINKRLSDSQTTAETAGELVLDFMKKSTKFMRHINRMYSRILVTAEYFKQAKEGIYFSLCSFRPDDFVTPIALSDDDLQTVKDVFSVKKRAKVNIDDQEYVEGYFGVNYRKVNAALAVLHRGIDEKAENAKCQLELFTLRGTEIRMALHKTVWTSTSSSKIPEIDGKSLTSQIEANPQSEKGGKTSKPSKYDVFICHACEDKEPFVRELAEVLSKHMKVWYDEFSLSLGDRLRRKIDQGIANSRYGIVILSENFFKKDWPQKELDGLVAKEHNFDKVILPIWHGVTRSRVESFSPILADRLAASSDKGMDFILKEILRVVSS